MAKTDEGGLLEERIVEPRFLFVDSFLWDDGKRSNLLPMWLELTSVKVTFQAK